MIRNPAGREQQHRRNNRRRERLGLAVAVGMVFVRRVRRHDDAAPDDDGTENVRERFDGVGDERVRMADNAREPVWRPSDETFVAKPMKVARRLRWRRLVGTGNY